MREQIVGLSRPFGRKNWHRTQAALENMKKYRCV